ncbi:MAG: alpha/beta hydrolase [Hyphomonadaceae bacterium]|nr:alpha/beta hydrolase [Hyphomonadaceae bacterium]
MLASRRDVCWGLAGAGLSLASAAGCAGVGRAPQMDPLALVDPELRAAAAQQASGPRPPPMSVEALPRLRAMWVAPDTMPPPAPSVETRTIPGRTNDPDVSVQVIGVRDAGRLRPAIVHMHGGGYVSGRAQNATVFCQRASAELDCVIVNVDYRLSPETPFPGPMEDNYAALKWLHRNAEALGVDRTKVAVMGESAGGGHAAILAIAARDRGEAPVAYQVLIYPMLDDRTGSTRRVPAHIGALGWNEAANRFGWSAFLGMPAGAASPPSGAVPSRLDNLAGLPPAFIGVGSIDLFVDESMEYARRLVDAGVPTQLHVTPGAFHAFDWVVPEARVSKEFTAAWKSALAAAFAA